jgi:hypothetical protein
MGNIVLVFNESTQKWEERPEPYITISVETKEDYEFLEAAVAFYETRDDYAKVVRCKDCFHYGDGHCLRRHDGGSYVPFPMDSDDFCSYGEENIWREN